MARKKDGAKIATRPSAALGTPPGCDVAEMRAEREEASGDGLGGSVFGLGRSAQ